MNSQPTATSLRAADQIHPEHSRKWYGAIPRDVCPTYRWQFENAQKKREEIARLIDAAGMAEAVARLEATTHMLGNLITDMRKHDFHETALANVRAIVEENRTTLAKLTT